MEVQLSPKLNKLLERQMEGTCGSPPSGPRLGVLVGSLMVAAVTINCGGEAEPASSFLSKQACGALRRERNVSRHGIKTKGLDPT